MCSTWLKTWESNDVSDIKIIIWRIEFNNDVAPVEFDDNIAPDYDFRKKNMYLEH